MDVEPMLTAIRSAFASDSTDEARRAGGAACRALLVALEPQHVQQNTPVNAAALAQAVSALRNVEPEKLLDLAIAKLRSALPAGVDVAPVKPIKFNLVRVPPRGTP